MTWVDGLKAGDGPAGPAPQAPEDAYTSVMRGPSSEQCVPPDRDPPAERSPRSGCRYCACGRPRKSGAADRGCRPHRSLR